MVHQPPQGTRDLLPLDVTQKQWIEERLEHVFIRWGYHRIMTSTLERLDTLMAGGAIERSSVLRVQPEDEGEIGLRPELTAPIARAAVTRLAGASHPLRLFYNASVFRQRYQGGSTTPQEFYQAGVELLGTGGTVADAEILLLLVDCLTNLELTRQCTDANGNSPPWFLVLGEAELTRSLLEPFPLNLHKQVLNAIARLDRIGLETLPLSVELRAQALFLLDLRGNPEAVLHQIGQLELNAFQQQRVQNLKNLVALFKETFRDALSHQFPKLASSPPLILDLSLVRTFDYYTGIIFEVVRQTPSGQWRLGQGGRYDQLLGLYHPTGKTYPGIGFALNIETLQQVLLTEKQLPSFTLASDWLVVPQNSQAHTEAFQYARKLRNSPQVVRVEIYLNEDISIETVRDYAGKRGIARIAWIRSGALPDIEIVTQKESQTF